MKNVEISQPGGPDVLRIVDSPIPEPGPNEVLIKVAAAGVNRPDVFQREGNYPPPPGASEIPGLEIAGTIVAGDTGSSGLNINDQVCALIAGGGYAEYCIAPIAQCLPIPAGFSMIQAAAIPETYFTVWSNVFDRAHLAPGETLLIHGGASGIGTTAISLARAFGHNVYATAGSDERVQAIENLGCTKGINYKTQDFVTEIKSLTSNRGVDVILDMVSGDYLERNIDSLAEDGRLVMIAQLGGIKGTVNCLKVMLKRLHITGSTLRARPVEFKAQIAQALHQKVWPLFEAGTIAPIIHSTFSLDQVQDAHRLMDAGDQIGKIVLEI